jgi:hypothetical protein
MPSQGGGLTNLNNDENDYISKLREEAFSNRPDLKEIVEPKKSILETFLPVLFDGMAEEQAETQNKYNLAMSGAETTVDKFKTGTKLNPLSKSFEAGYEPTGGVAGKVASKGLKAAGQRAAEEAQDSFQVVINNPTLAQIASRYTGLPTKANEISDMLAKFIPQGMKNAPAIVEKQYASNVARAAGVGAELENTLKTKQQGVLKNIMSYEIDGLSLAQHMEFAGLEPFRNYADDLISDKSVSAVHGAVKMVSDDIIGRNTSFMDSAAPTIANTVDIRVKGADEIWLPHGAHLWENDHGNATSMAAQKIKETAEGILKRGGMLDEGWAQQSQQFLDLVNDPDNLQRVVRLWNQLKSNHPPDVARKIIQREYPKIEKALDNSGYFDYLFDNFNRLADSQPFGMNRKELIELMGRTPSWKAR